MKVTKKQIYLIRDAAIKLHMDQPRELFWETYELIDEHDRRTLAYIEAANNILKLDLDIFYHKKRGQVRR